MPIIINESELMAYVYAEKALKHFKKTNNFLQAFNAESLILLQIGKDTNLDFQWIEERYQNLIHDSEILGALNKKGMFLNNLGLEYYKRKEYAKAQKYYDEALRIAEKSSMLYLKRLYNYVNTSFEGNLLKKSVLLKKAREGISLAKKLDNRMYNIVFKLLLLNIENKLDEYYSYLEKRALPYFKLNNHVRWINIFGKKMYNHYVETEQPLKAFHISNTFMRMI
ncbi:tetratricopeptide repeat protein [Heyndrickxia sp. NPDC080065]|uniref:tetratricopeptide repeat protein n=1 Tax=Heyndrickxia sp. NPDC080065 TaxID=3390568 RepID=UPI003D091684